MPSRTILYANFSPADHANLLAAKVAAHASAFLDGRHDAARLAANSHAVFCELIAAPEDAGARAVLGPVRLLVVAMMGAASAQDEARLDRWMHVMAALIELVRQECRALNAVPVCLSQAEGD